MEILFEDSASCLSILYDSLQAQRKIMIETASLIYTAEKAGDMEIVEEGFIDILNRIADEIIAMIVRIRDTVRNFIMRLNSRSASYEKVMKKYCSELQDFDIQPFSIDGYDFKISNDTRPNVKVIHELYLAYNIRMLDFNKLTSDQVKEICEKVTSEGSLGKKRGDLLGISDSVKQTDLKERAFKYYRNGQSEVGEIKITKDEIRAIIADYPAVIAERKYTIDEQRTLNILLNDMERDFKVNIPKRMKETPTLKNALYNEGPIGVADDVKVNGRVINQDVKIANLSDFNAYVNAKYKQTVAIATAVTTVYTARISAIESKMRQDEYIVREALDKKGRNVAEEFEIFDKYNSYPCTPNTNWASVTEGCNLIGGVLGV